MAEREPLFRIGERGFECALRNAASLRAYADLQRAIKVARENA